MTGFRQMLGVVLVCAAGLPAFADDLLPLETENTWFLENKGGVSATFTVEGVTQASDHKLARVRFKDNNSEHQWILFQDASGVSLAGFTLNGTDHYFDEPSPLFPANGTDGQVWTGAATTVVQMVSGISFRTPAGRMRDGVEYEIQFVDGLRQRWILVSGVGFAAGGETEARLLLQNYRLMPPSLMTAGGADEAPACPKIGISSIPVSPSLNTSDREAALAPVVGIGARFLSVSIGWDELEPEPFRYSVERVRDELALAAKYQVSTVLNIRPIDNVRDLRPADLANEPWDSSRTIFRFAAALDHLLEGLPPEVRWINIGYEVDPYFIARPDDAVPFLRFFQYASEIAKNKTGASVGTVFSFDVTRGYNDIFRLFEGNCDHVAFNYYALKSGMEYVHRSVQSPVVDTLIMRSMARGRTILIPETGYSSNPGIGGGPDAQAAFFSALFSGLKGGNFAAVNVWSLYDMPEEEVRNAQRAYRIEDVPGSGEFLSSLGLVTRDGSVKPSFSSISEELAKFAGCGF